MTLSLAILLLATAAPNTEAPAEGEATAQAKPKKEKKICRADGATGSRLTSKICKTQAEWDAQLGADANKLDGKRDSGAGY